MLDLSDLSIATCTSDEIYGPLEQPFDSIPSIVENVTLRYVRDENPGLTAIVHFLSCDRSKEPICRECTGSFRIGETTFKRASIDISPVVFLKKTSVYEGIHHYVNIDTCNFIVMKLDVYCDEKNNAKAIAEEIKKAVEQHFNTSSDYLCLIKPEEFPAFAEYEYLLLEI